ncbi:MAG TPA: hypothetical protein VJ604_16480, partial [Geomonas sp.]|nr:hypothetical protein [Geomonas sp.]
MKIGELVKMAAVAVIMALFAGCGGGSSTPSPPPATSKTYASGTASAGLIKNGTIQIYAANSDGSKGTLLASTTTDSQGQYTVTVQNYQGPVVIEATGSYVDEATSATTTIPASAPLRAGSMVSGDGSSIKIAVTPLTELAYRQAVAAAAGGTPIGTAISNANNQVSSTFGIDVLQVQPVEATQTALEGATMDQRAYVLALAGISQMSMTGNLSLTDTIGHMMQSEAPATDVTTAQN